MFGSEPRVRRPVLLMLVFGVLLVLVGITATAQAAMVSAYATTSTLNAIVQSDVATVRGFVRQGLDGVDVGAPDAAAVERLNAYLDTLVAKGEIVHAELRTPDGRVLASTDDRAAGQARPVSAAFRGVLGADSPPVVDIVAATAAEAGEAALPATVVREYVPLRQGDATLLVVALWRDATPILSQLDDLRRDVVIVTLTAALIAAAVLFVVFRSAQRRINRQTEALVSAARLDALTDSLNHGALVAHLAAEIERAREAGTPLGVALIDVDNFRLFNDNHGHRAGDEILLVLAGTLRERLADGIVMGRYGPDEILLVAGAEAVSQLEPLIEQLRAALADLSLQFEATERLPLTVSVGICTYPEHGRSVTALLSTVAATLHEAKAGGGDAVRVAGANADEQPVGASSFDVLQGLVFAVDTKDRYTKRHSEDVARYSVFLAERLGLDLATVQTIHVAALLHDVGKIGIPDPILRKPGRLTADELEVVKQHVALGDLIVRDLPDIDEVRAGIRHHHERWDGRGYLEALRGDEIPLIARIIAVGDAFSAMTTTRPYRKALGVREAMLRLGDAAGTQLDEGLVDTFIRGIETAPDAPLPGTEPPSAAIWTPRRRVA